jgi:hypothetical protein
MTGYVNVQITPNVKGLKRPSKRIKRSVPVAKEAARGRLEVVGKAPARGKATAVEDPSLTRSQLLTLRRLRGELGKLIASSYELYHLMIERETVIQEVGLESFMRESDPAEVVRLSYGKQGEPSRRRLTLAAIKALKVGQVKMDKGLLRKRLGCIDLVAVGEDDVEDLVSELVLLKDRLDALSAGVVKARVGSRDLDAEIRGQLLRMGRMLGKTGRKLGRRTVGYDRIRYRQMQSELEEMTAKLSLPTSKKLRLINALIYLEQAEVLLSKLLPERIEAKLAPYKEPCPWQVDLDIAQDFINAYSGMRLAWDMLFYMTNEAKADIVILDLGADDSAAWDEAIIATGKPPGELWEMLLARADDYKDQEVHVYHSDDVLLTKLPPGRGEAFAFKANRGRITEEQLRAKVWAPWL